MSPIEIGIAGMVLLLFFFFIGVPVSFSFALAGIISFSCLISPSAGLKLLSMQVFDTFADYFLTVVPMFVLMGSLAFGCGIGGRLFDAGYSVFGRSIRSLFGVRSFAWLTFRYSVFVKCQTTSYELRTANGEWLIAVFHFFRIWLRLESV